MSEEVEYKDMPNTPGYRVGNDGSIWSQRVTGNDRGRKRTVAWKRLAIYRRPYGSRYCVVGIRPIPGGKVRLLYVHRLVLEAFVGECPAGEVCLHRDRDTSNNRLGNIHWGTQIENAADRSRHGTQRRGEMCSYAKLKESQVREIKALWLARECTQQEIADRYGVSRSTVGDIVNGKRWPHVV